MAAATIYSEAMKIAICARIADGSSLRKICAESDMPDKRTVGRWLADPDREDFRLAYAAACELRAEALAEEALDIADDAKRDTKIVGEDGREVCDTEWVQRSKLRIETRKWLAGVMNPKKYGTKVDLNHSGGIAVTGVDRPPAETREEWLARRDIEMGAATGAAD